ncbi:MAG: hypothetical protein SAJ37_08845 [Oscillatoria sp. PMC 1068.18]|nr:hypothetical protein [Oscillatoria sp. PMC 1076.18]MEC4988840.1 hypothetical protein [Oscillatoria sp. PMC 1068.18]
MSHWLFNSLGNRTAEAHQRLHFVFNELATLRQQLFSRQPDPEEDILTCFESPQPTLNSRSPDGVLGFTQSLEKIDSTDSDQRLVGWEFKIVRSSRNLFADPAIFSQLCQEEALAGWILLEKLDDRRVRFKRLIAMRDLIDTENLPFDPYRSYYGSSSKIITLLMAIAGILTIALPAFFGYFLVSSLLTDSKTPPQTTPPNPAIESPADETEKSLETIPPQDFPPFEEEK